MNADIFIHKEKVTVHGLKLEIKNLGGMKRVMHPTCLMAHRGLAGKKRAR